MSNGPDSENRFSSEFRQLLVTYAETTLRWGPCDKCRLPVSPENNTAVFEFINSKGHWENLFNQNRHLEPVTDKEGRVICQGSPSRWQHISGMPDLRSEYRSEEGQNQYALDIWNLMQTLAQPQLSD